jgi:hypothetical protein
MTRPVTEPCGCKYRDHEWLHLCPEHERETREIHERWAKEHREQVERALAEERAT